ncbi:MAG: CoA transferase [Chloroflexi bacterium]|nr:CoA transferase [Chloroflexota bacterium]
MSRAGNGGPEVYPAMASSGAMPLSGIRVVEFTWVAAGPATSKLLANYGAQVIKVESTRHVDRARWAGSFRNHEANPNASGAYLRINDSKMCVTLDLRHPRGLALAKSLATQADIVVENLAPGALKRLGLGYDALRQLRPDVIMMSLSLLGQAGPYASMAGFGDTGQTLSGMTYLTGWPGRPPVGHAGPYTDFFVMPLAVALILAALDHRQRTGQGQYLDLSQTEAGVLAAGTAMLEQAANSRSPQRMGNRHPYYAPHGIYRCRGEDRWCAIAVTSDQEWQALVAVMGQPSWTVEARFATALARWRHRDDLDRLLESWTCLYTPRELMARLQAAGVPAGAVQDAQDIFTDPQVAHIGHLQEVNHGEAGTHCVQPPAYRLSETPARISSPAPCLGEHNAHVFRELLGISAGEYAELLRDNVLS